MRSTRPMGKVDIMITMDTSAPFYWGPMADRIPLNHARSTPQAVPWLHSVGASHLFPIRPSQEPPRPHQLRKGSRSQEAFRWRGLAWFFTYTSGHSLQWITGVAPSQRHRTNKDIWKQSVGTARSVLIRRLGGRIRSKSHFEPE